MTTTIVEVQHNLPSWWGTLLRGLVAIGLGIYAFMNPGVTIGLLVIVMAIYWLIDGIVSIVAAIFGDSGEHTRLWVFIRSGIQILAAILIFIGPMFSAALTTIFLLYFVAFQALVAGAMEIYAAIRLRKVIDNEWSQILSGVLFIALALLLIFFPLNAGALIVRIIGVLAVVIGVFLVVQAFRLRKMKVAG